MRLEADEASQTSRVVRTAVIEGKTILQHATKSSARHPPATNTHHHYRHHRHHPHHLHSRVCMLAGSKCHECYQQRVFFFFFSCLSSGNVSFYLIPIHPRYRQPQTKSSKKGMPPNPPNPPSIQDTRPNTHPNHTTPLSVLHLSRLFY